MLQMPVLITAVASLHWVQGYITLYQNIPICQTEWATRLFSGAYIFIMILTINNISTAWSVSIGPVKEYPPFSLLQN